ncbi:MAG: roadblock/LC7 domain-containing protein [Kiritimatiellae bacterium]|nr:roadblock/LC7 domain-containing protein [Kiritimatiellia bacterium]
MLYSMSQEQHRQIDNILLDLLARAEAEAVFLCDRGGNILVENTTEHYKHEENIAALAAGSFFATRELARLIGEPEFRYIFHRGETTSVYLQHAAADMLLMVVFGKQSNPGLVKLYSDESTRALDTVLRTMLNASRPGQRLTAAEIEIDDSKEPFKRVRGVGAS